MVVEPSLALVGLATAPAGKDGRSRPTAPQVVVVHAPYAAALESTLLQRGIKFFKKFFKLKKKVYSHGRYARTCTYVHVRTYVCTYILEFVSHFFHNCVIAFCTYI